MHWAEVAPSVAQTRAARRAPGSRAVRPTIEAASAKDRRGPRRAGDRPHRRPGREETVIARRSRWSRAVIAAALTPPDCSSPGFRDRRGRSATTFAGALVRMSEARSDEAADGCARRAGCGSTSERRRSSPGGCAVGHAGERDPLAALDATTPRSEAQRRRRRGTARTVVDVDPRLLERGAGCSTSWLHRRPRSTAEPMSTRILIPIGVMPSNRAWMRLSLRRLAPVLVAASFLRRWRGRRSPRPPPRNRRPTSRWARRRRRSSRRRTRSCAANTPSRRSAS